VVALLARDAELVALDLVLDTLQAQTLQELADVAPLLRADADVERDRLAHRSLRRFLDLAVTERLQRNAALHELLLEHLCERLESLLALGVELDRLVLELDRAVGSLEVESRRDLARRLIDSVAELLEIDLGDDVEARHGARTPRGRKRGGCYCTPRVRTRVAKGDWLESDVASYGRMTPPARTR